MGEEQQKALREVNDMLYTYLIIISPVKNLTLTLYLTLTNKTVGVY